MCISKYLYHTYQFYDRLPAWRQLSSNIISDVLLLFGYCFNLAVGEGSKSCRGYKMVSLIESHGHPTPPVKHWWIFRHVSGRFNVIYLHSWSSHLKRFTPMYSTHALRRLTRSHPRYFGPHLRVIWPFYGRTRWSAALKVFKRVRFNIWRNTMSIKFCIPELRHDYFKIFYVCSIDCVYISCGDLNRTKE
jgi:hypothetical protein